MCLCVVICREGKAGEDRDSLATLGNNEIWHLIKPQERHRQLRLK